MLESREEQYINHGGRIMYFLNSIDENNDFTLITKDNYFVDKTELISKLNKLVNTSRRYLCITRPRRFGKSINALMLASYYSKNLDTKNIFDKLNIAKDPSYEKHLNKHNVIYMSFNDKNENFTTYADYKAYFRNGLINDLRIISPDIDESMPIGKIFNEVYSKTNEGFIFIIDEWDYIFNKGICNDEEKENFLAFLENLLKDKSYVDFAYMTGVLPIAKYFSTSFCNMFPNEHTAFDDRKYDHYFGFTENEVVELYNKQEIKNVSLEELQDWYDGYYTYNGTHLYNPRSVNYALSNGYCANYWTNTSAADEIIECIKRNVDSVKEDIVKMINGEKIRITLSGFSSEKMEFKTREQILSILVTLGFLSYHKKYLRIPNTELRIKFADSLKNDIFGELSKILAMADDMLNATLIRDTETMSRILQDAHSKFSSVRHYNDENSISCVITLVYLTAIDEYEILREEPAGVGYADFIFKPRDKVSPAFIIELKKDKSVEEALQQIRAKNYAQKLDDCTGEKFAIGINYMTENTSEDDNRRHFIKIEELE